MVMDTIQIRLSGALLKQIDSLVSKGIYSSRSDALRDAARILFFHNQAGTISFKGDSVKAVRKIREKLSKEPIDLDEINSM